jgi:hypothetical protein
MGKECFLFWQLIKVFQVASVRHFGFANYGFNIIVKFQLWAEKTLRKPKTS